MLSAAGIDYASQKDVRPVSTYVMSATERQARDFVKECGDLAEFFADSDVRFECSRKATVLEFKLAGTRITALPSTHRAIRGVQGRLVLDEICFMPRFEEIWGAALPISRPNLKDPNGYPVSVLSTPWARGTKAFQVLTNPEYILREVNLMRAIADGFPLPGGIERLKAEIGSEDIFNVEYMCQWLDTGLGYFPSHILERAVVKAADDVDGTGLEKELRGQGCKVHWGWDVGRKHDLTVGAKFYSRGDTWFLVDLIVMRGVPLDIQAQRAIEAITKYPKDRLESIRIDRGTQGYAVYDALMTKFGSEIVSSADLNQDAQVRHMMQVKSMLERQKLKWCNEFSGESCRTLMTEFLKIEQKSTAGGRVVIDTPRDMHGHCDRAWAVAIGVGKYQRDRGKDDSSVIVGLHSSPINDPGTYTDPLRKIRPHLDLPE